MMKIQSVHIKNYRALTDIRVDFDTVTTFIGPNGVGKSSILRALDWYFNGKSGSLTDDDCSFGNTDQNIEVGVTFSNLTERDHSELGKYAPDDVQTFTAWKRRRTSGEEFFSANAKGFPEFTEIKEATKASEKKKLYAQLRSSQPKLELPAASTGQAVTDAMTSWETEHVSRLVDIPEILQTNFFGFNSNGKMSGLFDYVLVTADLHASEETVDARTSIIARILERAIDRTAADEEIAQIVEDTRQRQQTVYEDKFGAQLDDLTKTLNDVVARYSPDRSIKVQPSEFDLKPPRTTFDVSVLDGENETSVDRQGHGFQRTLLISALQILARSSIAPDEGTICLAIEEPELFQHPIQEKTFAKVLRELAENQDRNVQVTYATHSPYFLEARHFDQIRRLSRNSSTHAVTIHSTTVADVKNKLQGTVKAKTVDSQLDNIVTDQLAIALFANKVLLVEGTTDIAVFYGIGDKEGVGSLEAQGISIVACGGKTSIPLVHAILTSLDIPTYSLFDGDADGENKARLAGKDGKIISDRKLNNILSNRKILKYFGAPETDFPPDCTFQNIASFHDTLEPFLKNQWPEWMETYAEVQQEIDEVSGKNEAVYRTVTRRAGGSVPNLLRSILENVKDL